MEIDSYLHLLTQEIQQSPHSEVAKLRLSLTCQEVLLFTVVSVDFPHLLEQFSTSPSSDIKNTIQEGINKITHYLDQVYNSSLENFISSPNTQNKQVVENILDAPKGLWEEALITEDLNGFQIMLAQRRITHLTGIAEKFTP